MNFQLAVCKYSHGIFARNVHDNIVIFVRRSIRFTLADLRIAVALVPIQITDAVFNLVLDDLKRFARADIESNGRSFAV